MVARGDLPAEKLELFTHKSLGYIFTTSSDIESRQLEYYDIGRWIQQGSIFGFSSSRQAAALMLYLAERLFTFACNPDEPIDRAARNSPIKSPMVTLPVPESWRQVRASPITLGLFTLQRLDPLDARQRLQEYLDKGFLTFDLAACRDGLVVWLLVTRRHCRGFNLLELRRNSRGDWEMGQAFQGEGARSWWLDISLLQFTEQLNSGYYA